MTVYKMLDVVGTSNTSVSDAITAAVHRAGATIRHLDWFEVKEIRGRLNEARVAEYQVKVEIGYRLEAAQEHTGDATEQSEQVPNAEARSVMAQAARKGGERQREDLARGAGKGSGS